MNWHSFCFGSVKPALLLLILALLIDETGNK